MKHIILDVGGVIFEYGKKPLLGKMPKKLKKYSTAVDLGKITFTELVKKYNEQEKTNYTVRTFLEKAYKNRRYNKELIAFCKKTGCKISILSNNSRANISYARKHFDFSWAKPQVYSYNLGIKKPDPAMYTYILSRLRALPNECVFIDDKIRNTKIAKKLGMNVVVFKSRSQTIRELKIMLKR